jgi:hypothetical protein
MPMKLSENDREQIEVAAEKCRDCTGNCDICSTYNFLSSLDESTGSE